MALDLSFMEQNRVSTERMRSLGAHLSDEEMMRPVGEHWTVAVVYTHLAWWDRRVLDVLARVEQAGEVLVPQLDTFVNDLSLPLWAAVPPREAVRIAIETAESLDARLESYPRDLLEKVYADTPRWVVRAIHRNEHLDEVDAVLSG